MNEKALVTLTIGTELTARWRRHCLPSINRYAAKHGYDLIVFEEPFDVSSRATHRSPAWQKCLILSQPAVQKYKRVVWIDADIVISDDCPSICNYCGEDEIGAVDQFSFPGGERQGQVLRKLYASYARKGLPYLEDLTPQAYNENGGFPPLKHVVQTGVLVLNPKLHRATMEYVYHSYEDRGGSLWHYEQRPLSYEFIRRDKVKWLDHRFNYQFIFFSMLYFSWLHSWADSSLSRSLAKYLSKHPRIDALCSKISDRVRSKIVHKALERAYFLHFAGCADELKYIYR